MVTKEDDYLKTMLTSSIDNIFDDELQFNDGFGINASVIADPPTADLDIMPSFQCQCCPDSTNALDRYLHQLETDTIHVSNETFDCLLHNLLSDDPVSHAPILDRNFGGPCAHPSYYYLYAVYKHIDGGPEFKCTDPIIDSCPTCLTTKMKKSSAGSNSTQKTTVPWQGISIHFTFTGQRSKDKTCAASYCGINGEACYILLADHATLTLNSTPHISKGAPIKWLDNWLQQNAPKVPGQYVYLDQGSKLYNNQKVCALFQHYGYTICPTSADSSHQNGPVKQAHQTIGNALCTMLIGANLDAHFWP
jgi:hypothetical protein